MRSIHSSKTSWFAWTLCALVGILAAFGCALTLAGLDASHKPATIVKTVLEAIVPFAFGAVGALIVARQPRNTISWLLMTIGLGWASGSIVTSYLAKVVAHTQPTLVTLLLVWFSEWDWWLLMGPLLFILLLFPTGRLPSRRWRWVSGALMALFGIFLLISGLSETLNTGSGVQFANPIGVIPYRLVDSFLSILWAALLLATLTLCVASVFVRYRRASGVERSQIRWFLYACAIFLIFFVPNLFIDQDNQDSILTVLLGIVFDLTVLGIVASIGIAILRYRLYDIDIIIRRTLIYTLLTLTLGAVYAVIIITLQALFRQLTGETSTLAVVASTLVIAALFQPLRRRVQNLIDRRFYRKKYNARQVLEAFAQRVQTEADIDALAADTIGVVQDTLQPESVQLWLREVPIDKV